MCWNEMLPVKLGWRLSVVPCVHLFYPANGFALVLLHCEYHLSANLSARNLTRAICFKQVLEQNNEKQCLHLQDIFWKPNSRCHSHLAKVNFVCATDLTDLRTTAVLEESDSCVTLQKIMATWTYSHLYPRKHLLTLSFKHIFRL